MKTLGHIWLGLLMYPYLDPAQNVFIFAKYGRNFKSINRKKMLSDITFYIVKQC